MPEPSRSQRIIGDLAPKYVQVTDDVLFGDIWERTEISSRDRSLATVSALVALYRVNQLPFHLQKALDNGLTKEELAETITHLAFYSGWPCASSALSVLKSIVEPTTSEPPRSPN